MLQQKKKDSLSIKQMKQTCSATDLSASVAALCFEDCLAANSEASLAAF